MAGRNVYDISPRDREVLEFRAARRNALRQEFLKQTLNPYRHSSLLGGSIFDEQLQRLFSMEATRAQYIKSTTKSTVQYSFIFLIPLATLAYVTWNRRKSKRTALETGQVSYRDRRPKFL